MSRPRTGGEDCGLGTTGSRFLIADDLTGAADAGVLFAGWGPVRVSLDARGWPGQGPGLHVLDADTRRRTPAAAAARAERIALRLRRQAGERPPLYLKVDSTLRGPLAAQLEVYRRVLGFERVILAPSLPAQGRTVVGGRLHVRGGPATALALPATVQLLDAGTDEDLDAIAARLAADGGCLAAGSAGLAGALARRAGAEEGQTSPPAVRSLLAVVGSRNPTSQGQAARLDEAGGGVIVLRVASGAGAADDRRVAASLAQAAVRRLAELPAPAALLATGGDTARALLAALGARSFEPRGELAPGMPWSVVPGRAEVLVTKAGGFGGETALVEAARRLGVTGG